MTRSEALCPRPNEKDAWKMPAVNLERLFSPEKIHNESVRKQLINSVTAVLELITECSQKGYFQPIDIGAVEGKFIDLEAEIATFRDYTPPEVMADVEVFKREIMTYLDQYNRKR